MLFAKFLLALTSCAVAITTAGAQTLPEPPAAAPKWQLYFEAGPKGSQFRNVYQGTTTLVPGGPDSGTYRVFRVDNTVSAFASVKAFCPLSRHLLVSAATGLDMQQLDFVTSWRASRPGSFAGGGEEHVVRLLSRVRLEAGLHAAMGLGTAGELRPGVSLGQMLNVSNNGFSYSYVQPELCYAAGRLLLSARASFMPYNTTIPDIDAIARRDDRAVVERQEFRITEFQLGLGVKL